MWLWFTTLLGWGLRPGTSRRRVVIPKWQLWCLHYRFGYAVEKDRDRETTEGAQRQIVIVI